APHVMNQLGSLLQVGEGVQGLQEDFGVDGFGFPKDGLGFFRIVFWPWLGPSRMPGTGRSIDPSGDLAAAIKHRLLNRLMVDGVRRGPAQLLVRKRAFLQVKD